MKRNEQVIGDDGKFTHLLAHSLVPSLRCKLRDVTNVLRNKNNLNAAITITRLLQTDINNNKLIDVLHLESFKAKLTSGSVRIVRS